MCNALFFNDGDEWAFMILFVYKIVWKQFILISKNN